MVAVERNSLDEDDGRDELRPAGVQGVAVQGEGSGMVKGGTELVDMSVNRRLV